jgi:hypothetical protein
MSSKRYVQSSLLYQTLSRTHFAIVYKIPYFLHRMHVLPIRSPSAFAANDDFAAAAQLSSHPCNSPFLTHMTIGQASPRLFLQIVSRE